MKPKIVYANILGRVMRCEVIPQIRIFPNGQVEVGNGKPGYDWHPAYSQKMDSGSVSQPLTLSHWRAIAKRDGAKLIQFKTEREAALPLTPAEKQLGVTLAEAKGA